MKINKILAAGVAATLAVTSLSAVVSAEQQTKSFELFQTYAGYSKQTVEINADVNKAIADRLTQTNVQKVIFDAPEIWQSLTVKNGIGAIDGMRIVVSGYQGPNASQPVEKTFTLVKGAKDAADKNIQNKWYIVVLDKDTPIYHDGEFASFFFYRITSLKLQIDVAAWTGDSEANYKIINDAKTIFDFDAGDISIETRDTGVIQYTYGQDNVNTNDLNRVKSEAAKDEVTQYVAGDNTAATNMGAIVGSAYHAVGADYPSGSPYAVGSELQATQIAYVGAGITVVAYTAGADADAPVDIAGADITGFAKEAEASKTQPIVFGKEIKTSGNIYKITVGEGNDAKVSYYYSTATIDETAAKATTKFDKAGLMNVKTADDAKLPVYTPVDTTTYTSFVGSDETVVGQNNAAGIAEKGAWIVKDANTGEYTFGTSALNGQAYDAAKLGKKDSTAHLLAYAFANGGWYESKSKYGDADDTYLYADNKSSESQYKPSATVYTYKQNAWLPVTTGITANRTAVDYKGATTIYREDVKRLSETSDQNSKNDWNSANTDGNQTYKDEMTAGTNPMGFAGLASQVANFFNHQDNGTITFTFAAAASSTGSSAWSSGVPSTEVGLIGSGAGTVTSNFALFFNYNSTGGMMYAPTKADLTSGTVTFDISQYLKDSGTLTKATLHDIYYGLNVGIYDKDKNYYGMWVSKVDLAYDDAPAADADAAAADDDATVADDDDAAAVVDADDDDDDDTALIEDDDDDDDDDATIIADDDDDDTDDDDIAAVITDDDEDDTAAAGTVDVVTPAAQDSNPATGVGLAVIPAIVAAAAMAISKKRK